MIKEELAQAIENLYQIFSRYPFKSSIEGCPCCVSNTDKAALHSKPLRKLEDEDISYYAFKAMTTFGDLEDFKHYLPRIFELMTERKLVVDTFVILGKLDYGKWYDWEQKEQNVIIRFLLAWWKNEINHGYFNSELLIEINKRLENFPILLSYWNLDVETQGFKNFIDFLEFDYPDVIHKNRTFKAFKEPNISTFKSWTTANSHKLEEGFFKFEARDKEFAERISDVLYMFERIH
jgi:hypothetical protein